MGFPPCGPRLTGPRPSPRFWRHQARGGGGGARGARGVQGRGGGRPCARLPGRVGGCGSRVPGPGARPRVSCARRRVAGTPPRSAGRPATRAGRWSALRGESPAASGRRRRCAVSTDPQVPTEPPSPAALPAETGPDCSGRLGRSRLRGDAGLAGAEEAAPREGPAYPVRPALRSRGGTAAGEARFRAVRKPSACARAPRVAGPVSRLGL